MLSDLGCSHEHKINKLSPIRFDRNNEIKRHDPSKVHFTPLRERDHLMSYPHDHLDAETLDKMSKASSRIAAVLGGV